MPKFYIYIEGSGEGCDYTIGCNVKLVPLDSNTREEALEEAKVYYQERDGREGRILFEGLLLLSHEKNLPVGLWKREVEDRNEQDFIDKEREKDTEEFKRLRKKLGK